MEPNTKLLLDRFDALAQRFDDQDARWGQRFTDLERGLADRDAAIDQRLAVIEGAQIDQRLTALEAAHTNHVHAARDDCVAVLEAATAMIGSRRPD